MALITPPKLSEPQKRVIDKLHPSAREKFARFISDIEAKTGWKVIVTSGYRTFAEQAALKAQNSSNASPGSSYHNYGLAIDINLLKNGVTLAGAKDADVLQKADTDAEWNATGVPQLAKAMGLRWGGDFSSYQDPIHFDLGNKYDINKLKQLAAAQFGANPANVKGNEIKLA